MQVILLDKVLNLGNLGEVVKVKDGYARNFLIPSGRARRATDTAIKEFEARRAELEKQAADKLSAAQGQGEKLSGANVKLTQKAACSGPSPTMTLPKNSARWDLTCTSPRCACPMVRSRPSAKARCKSPCTPMWWWT